MTDRIDDLVHETKLILYQADEPLTQTAILSRTAVADRDEVNEVLRKMIANGMITSTPEWNYKLGTRARRSVETPTSPG